jgi:WD40 repeat protein
LDRQVKVWDVRTGAVALSVKCAEETVWSLGSSDDGLLVSAGGDGLDIEGVVRFVDLESNSYRGEITVGSDVVLSVAVTGRRGLVAVGGSRGGSIALYETEKIVVR